MSDQEGHLLVADQFGGDDEIALVLPVRVVGHHDHLTRRQRGDGPLYSPCGSPAPAHGASSSLVWVPNSLLR
ncbi:hypothetical protein ABZ464_37725 [Streptomyces sp. NPDC005820]|uniref:hypothetical protein n=1 Tax=Streptomyces sp. NPDC005820 TaxID=3157069 RepID=UPI0033D6DD05